jgi:ABC transporter
MGHLDVSRVSYALPDGTPLLDDVSFRVPAGGVVALVGANGAGKSTLLHLIAGEIPLQTGTVTTSGTIGVMPQFIGSVRDRSVVRDLLLAAAPQRLRGVAAAVDAAELALMEADDEPLQMTYAQALADWADAGGYDLEVRLRGGRTGKRAVVSSRAGRRGKHGLDAVGSGRHRSRSWEMNNMYKTKAAYNDGLASRYQAAQTRLRNRHPLTKLDEPDNYLDVPGRQFDRYLVFAANGTVRETDQPVWDERRPARTAG